MQPSTDLGAGYGWLLLETLLALAAVCLLALVALRWGLKRLAAPTGVGRAGHLRVIERVVVDPKKSLLLVEVGGRVLLVGAGEGTMALLAELDPKTIPPAPARTATTFREVLARTLGRAPAPAAAVGVAADRDDGSAAS